MHVFMSCCLYVVLLIIIAVQKVNLVEDCTGSPSSDKENDFSTASAKRAMTEYVYNVKVNGRVVDRVPHQVLV